MYLVHDPADADGEKPVEEQLAREGHPTRRRSFDGTRAEVRQLHGEALLGAEALVVYCSDPERWQWLPAQLREWESLGVAGRRKPMAVLAPSPVEMPTELDMTVASRLGDLLVLLRGRGDAAAP